MNIQESIRRILKEETEIPSFIRRRIRPDYIEETFHDVVEIMVRKFKRKPTGYNNVNNFKVQVLVRVMEELVPYLNDTNLTMELKKKFIDFLFDYYGKDLEEIYKGEIEPETNINESKKLLRRFPQEEMEQIFSEALETVTEQFIESRQQNYMMTYLDFRDEVTSLMLIEIRNNYEELYNYYNENEFEFMYFIYKLYGDIIFKRYIELSKVKKGRNLNEDNSKKDYTKILKTLIQPYLDKDCVCDIRIGYDEEDDMYGIYIVFSVEELNDMFVGVYRYRYVNTMRKDIYEELETYFPINNVYVGSYETQTCK